MLVLLPGNHILPDYSWLFRLGVLIVVCYLLVLFGMWLWKNGLSRKLGLFIILFFSHYSNLQLNVPHQGAIDNIIYKACYSF